ncbi:uncharacterized protein L969DRAFT_624813 [Mixia osmundae IAM 14324]|uniref:uncharacterized protein n=1 Tax=Mixia osmundae (strain CBS 9802 / IAM 14324 / JCM 22182 / KY 12970) TaxID=764103 RepID=UPI0004A559CB|nr:uncharacterized protein L969DRAFT_624813 [Mixia osmundae IAM 14324]KEI38892.1 hypothetical protein L969DRAFT_624813 [Mixia osmundae IAM 14324]
MATDKLLSLLCAAFLLYVTLATSTSDTDLASILESPGDVSYMVEFSFTSSGTWKGQFPVAVSKPNTPCIFTIRNGKSSNYVVDFESRPYTSWVRGQYRTLINLKVRVRPPHSHFNLCCVGTADITFRVSRTEHGREISVSFKCGPQYALEGADCQGSYSGPSEVLSTANLEVWLSSRAQEGVVAYRLIYNGTAVCKVGGTDGTRAVSMKGDMTVYGNPMTRKFEVHATKPKNGFATKEIDDKTRHHGVRVEFSAWVPLYLEEWLWHPCCGSNYERSGELSLDRWHYEIAFPPPKVYQMICTNQAGPFCEVFDTVSVISCYALQSHIAIINPFDNSH